MHAPKVTRPWLPPFPYNRDSKNMCAMLSLYFFLWRRKLSREKSASNFTRSLAIPVVNLPRMSPNQGQHPPSVFTLHVLALREGPPVPILLIRAAQSHDTTLRKSNLIG
ncbi:hypothetical protein AVEN_271920-1 [Araneus ventricosus]|uniref:Uncharacterized protein n=1 Tax=Araneus ventricosus TaxID=182803 RepID=A0A4Y2CBK6_ARAVE|nr:hypothetical protein AVEN_271920-1 [Araneus ventricosus]